MGFWNSKERTAWRRAQRWKEIGDKKRRSRDFAAAVVAYQEAQRALLDAPLFSFWIEELADAAVSLVQEAKSFTSTSFAARCVNGGNDLADDESNSLTGVDEAAYELKRSGCSAVVVKSVSAHKQLIESTTLTADMRLMVLRTAFEVVRTVKLVPEGVSMATSRGGEQSYWVGGYNNCTSLALKIGFGLFHLSKELVEAHGRRFVDSPLHSIHLSISMHLAWVYLNESVRSGLTWTHLLSVPDPRSQLLSSVPEGATNSVSVVPSTTSMYSWSNPPPTGIRGYRMAKILSTYVLTVLDRTKGRHRYSIDQLEPMLLLGQFYARVGLAPKCFLVMRRRLGVSRAALLCHIDSNTWLCAQQLNDIRDLAMRQQQQRSAALLQRVGVAFLRARKELRIKARDVISGAIGTATVEQAARGETATGQHGGDRVGRGCPGIVVGNPLKASEAASCRDPTSPESALRATQPLKTTFPAKGILSELRLSDSTCESTAAAASPVEVDYAVHFRRTDGCSSEAEMDEAAGEGGEGGPPLTAAANATAFAVPMWIT